MVTLRRFHLDDAETLSRHLSDRAVVRYLSDAIPFPYTLERAERFVRAACDDFPLDCAIDVCGELAGAINLLEKSDVFRANLEVGYWVARSFWGRGVAREALRQMTRFAFRDNEIMRVYANVFAVNVPSCRVLEACGFQREGFHPGSMLKRGTLYDGAVYAAPRNAWLYWDQHTPPFAVR